MARFRATIRGNRGEASRLGTADSGIDAAVNGWDSGVAVKARNDNGKDLFLIYSTGGSNGGEIDRLIGGVSIDMFGKVRFSDLSQEKV